VENDGNSGKAYNLVMNRVWSRFRALRSAVKNEEPASTISLDRPISGEERAIAEWLLIHSKPSAIPFLPQLDGARVTGLCSCGCPTVDLRVVEGISPAQTQDNLVGDALGEVNGNMVGVMLLQSGGYLTCLEIYDLSDIPHPYGLPDLKSLRPLEAGSSHNGSFVQQDSASE
jgi:hypothetical protein